LAETPAHLAAHPLPPAERIIVTIGVMMAVLLQVLDTTIANVALPHMQASLSATQESINWVLTSYIVASAIALPISGWLADRVGRKRLLLISVVGFTVASLLCASAVALTEMVFFRALQGVSGAFIVPLAQATLFDINPREKHGQAMALFGGGVMIGPILGPVLGGWLTDNYNWRWVFLVNLPVGVICTFVMMRFMPKTETVKRNFDVFGFALLAIALGAFQMFLDRGEQKDWFESWEIIIELGLAMAAAWMFVIQIATSKHPLFERSMFKDRNFSTGLLFMAVTGILLLAGLALLPPLLQNMYGYSVLQSGFLTAPRGVGTLISMLMAGRLVGKVDSRLLVGIGVTLMGVVAVDDDRLCDRSALTTGYRQRRRPGAGTRPDLRAAAEPCVRNTCAEHADDCCGAPQPCPEYWRLSRHFRSYSAARADDPGGSRRHCVARHRADDPDRQLDIFADYCAARRCRAGSHQCRDHPASRVHRLSRRLQAYDAGDVRRAPSSSADEARQGKVGSGGPRQHVAMD
jgi:multidrug resistance protein